MPFAPRARRLMERPSLRRSRRWIDVCSPSVHRQDPSAGPECRGALAGQADQPEHAAPLGAVRLEQLEHAGIVAARLAGEVPAHRCAGSGSRRSARRRRRRTPDRAPCRSSTDRRPGSRASFVRRLSAPSVAHSHSAVGDAGDGDERAGSLDLDADRMEPPRRHPRPAARVAAVAAGRGTDRAPARRADGRGAPTGGPLLRP